ncbi:Soluble guanylate cyclase gcy-35 [Aphelenchoides besseyi]|nr:Soluble guanylate cyclase gcy-35 [Aphelenchoides besseyi]
MYGWIHESFRQLITRKYGRDVWLRIIEISNVEDGTEREINKYYRDDETYRLATTIGSVLGIPVEEVAYGQFLIQYTMETGWDELLRAMSFDLEGFLDGLDGLHYFIDHVVYRTRLKGPSFRCEPQADETILLHYYSRRSNLFPIVKGVVREAARRLFGVEVLISVVERRQDQSESLINEHVIFKISKIENNLNAQHTRLTANKLVVGHGSNELVNNPMGYSLNISDFCGAFPHHFCFDRNLVVEHVVNLGIHMKKTFPFIRRGETKFSDILHLSHPEIPFDFESIYTFRNSLFVFQMKESAKERSNTDLRVAQFPITLKGAMVTVDDGNYMVFMCSLNVSSIRELIDRNLYVSDIQRHDSTRDLIMLNQSRLSQVELNRRLEETTRNLKQMAVVLEGEKQKTEDLLCELMPASVAESLRQGNTVEASEFSEASILFTDIVTFTNICAMCSPYDVVNLLNDLYLRFDSIVGLHDVYKVETIGRTIGQAILTYSLGDAYMIVGGVPTESPFHAEQVLNASIALLMESKYVHSPITHQAIKIRVGVHTGPVISGVVGIKMPRYCLFGSTVTIANRMESTGVPCRIHVSELTRDLALKTNPSKDQKMHTYFLERNDNRSVWDLCGRERNPEHTLDGYTELHQAAGMEETSEKKSIQNVDSNQTNGFIPKKKTENGKIGFCSAACHIL